MKHLLSAAFCALLPFAASAATFTPTFITSSYITSGAQGTQMYRADLSGIGLSTIASIKVTDSNSQTGGSPGIYSGFDLDAIFLDVDGSLATSDDRYYGSSFLYTAGTARSGGYPGPSTSGGPMNGASSATTVDTAFATLDAIDAVWFGTGSVTLGDGGSLTSIFSPEVALGASLYLFVGEVSGDRGENVSGQITVSDRAPPVVPLPAAGLLLLGGIGALGALRARRRA